MSVALTPGTPTPTAGGFTRTDSYAVTGDLSCCCDPGEPQPCCGYDLSGMPPEPPAGLPATLIGTIESADCPWIEATVTLNWAGYGWYGTGAINYTGPGTPPLCHGQTIILHVVCGESGFTLSGETFPSSYVDPFGQCVDPVTGVPVIRTDIEEGCSPIFIQFTHSGIILNSSGGFPCCPYDGTTGGGGCNYPDEGGVEGPVPSNPNLPVGGATFTITVTEP